MDTGAVNEHTLIADGFDDALIGFGRQFDKIIAVYSYERCLNVIMRNGISREDAEEYMELNVVGAYLGPYTPVFIHTDAEIIGNSEHDRITIN